MLIIEMEAWTAGKELSLIHIYLTRAEKDGVVLDVSGDLPKSFGVCDHPYHPQIVYLSQLNTSTLKNRAESGKLVL